MVEEMTYQIRRIFTENTLLRGKDYVTKKEEALIYGAKDIIFEEKLDGKQLQFELPEYPNFLFIGEFMKKTHTILYKSLPSFRYIFDIYDRNSNRFLGYEEKIPLILQNGLIPARIVASGSVGDSKHLESLITGTRSYFKSSVNEGMLKFIKSLKKVHFTHKSFTDVFEGEDFVEGIVLKSSRESRPVGKVVNPTFEEMIDICGRYEKYNSENRLDVYSLEKYVDYVRNEVLIHLSKLGILIDMDDNQLLSYYGKYCCTL